MKIIIKNLQKKIPVYPKRIKSTILRLLSQEGAKKIGEITVCFVNDATIRQFNRRFLGRNRPTDVLAFAMTYGGAKYRIADIMVSVDTAMRNSRVFKTMPADEIRLYVVHGILHLLGYDDRTQKQKLIMHKKERLYVHP